MKAKTPVHFGPVWGRSPSQSMALCMEGKDPGKESRTMTRCLTVTCPECLKLLQKQDAALAAKKGGV